MSVSSPRIRIVLRPMAAGERITTCMATVEIDGETVWPVRGEPDVALEAQIDDLLGYLTEFWKPLMLRQVYPINVSPLRPSGLRLEAARRWAELLPPIVVKEEEAVDAFEEAHDLSRAFAGIFGLPSFWILRSGEEMIVETAGLLRRLPIGEARRSLAATGDDICKRLASVPGGRWGTAIEAWRRRGEGDPASLLAWSAGLDQALARSFIEEGTLAAPRDFDDAANDNDELRIAARMAGALPPTQIREIVGLARQFGKLEAEKLRKLASECSRHIEQHFADSKPFVQGEVSAGFVREWLGIAKEERVDVFALVMSLGVAVRTARAEPPTLDGLAIWGKLHGPGAFLNEASNRILPRPGDVTKSAGARVTLAHELCHLLLDGDHALSAVEVLKARMPVGVEQRAKSFAGEFLLPTISAAAAWVEAGRPFGQSEIKQVVIDLTERFGVTRSVAAWKLEHGAALQDIELSAVLDAVAPYR